MQTPQRYIIDRLKIFGLFFYLTINRFKTMLHMPSIIITLLFQPGQIALGKFLTIFAQLFRWQVKFLLLPRLELELVLNCFSLAAKNFFQ